MISNIGKRILRGSLALLLLIVALFFTGVFWPSTSIAPVKTGVPVAINNISIIDLASGEVLHGALRARLFGNLSKARRIID